MEAGYSKHKVANYWDLFTGKYGQPGAPTYSKITVSTEAIQVDSYTANSSASATPFDSFKILKNKNNSASKHIEASDRMLYPIPAGRFINTRLSDIVKVEAIDLAGRTTTLPFELQQIDTSMLDTGMYLLQITTQQSSNMYKLLKQ